MSTISDAISSLFGGGGGGGGDGNSAMLSWLKSQAAKEEQTTAREQQQADAIAVMRRGEVADRTGYSGTVAVGDAQRRTDATLASEMSGLDATDPIHVAYLNALQAEASQNTDLARVQSGELYKAQDAWQAIRDAAGKTHASLADIQGWLDQANSLQSQYSWYTGGNDLVEALKKRLSDKQSEAAMAAAFQADAAAGNSTNAGGG